MNRWISALADAARSTLSTMTKSRAPAAKEKQAAGRTAGRAAPTPGGTQPRPAPTRPAPTRPGGAYPGDFTGVVRAQYSPALDGNPDPGEVVWTWVPYEEDFTQGKDRPVLLVGRDGDWLLGLMLTSKDHSRDGGRAGRADGPRWMDIGAGPWDSRGRESEVRLDRVLRVDPGAVRREGAIVEAKLFGKVARAIG